MVGAAVGMQDGPVVGVALGDRLGAGLYVGLSLGFRYPTIVGTRDGARVGEVVIVNTAGSKRFG
jgi:hypothetical protein